MTMLTGLTEENSSKRMLPSEGSFQLAIHDILLSTSRVLREKSDHQISINETNEVGKLEASSLFTHKPSHMTGSAILTDCAFQGVSSKNAQFQQESIRRRHAMANKSTENKKKLADLTSWIQKSFKADRRHSDPVTCANYQQTQRNQKSYPNRDAQKVLELERTVQMARDNLKRIASLQQTLKNVMEQKLDHNEKTIAALHRKVQRSRTRSRHIEKTHKETTSILISRRNQHGSAAHKLKGQLCSLRGQILMMDKVTLPPLQSKFAKIRLSEQTLKSNISEEAADIESQIYEADTCAKLDKKLCQIRQKFTRKNLAIFADVIDGARDLQEDHQPQHLDMADEVEMEVNMQKMNLWSIQDVIDNRVGCYDDDLFPDCHAAMAFSETIKRIARQADAFSSKVDDVSYLVTIGPNQVNNINNKEIKFDFLKDTQLQQQNELRTRRRNMKAKRLRTDLEMRNIQIQELESHLDYYNDFVPSLESSLEECRIIAQERKTHMAHRMEDLRAKVVSFITTHLSEGGVDEVTILLQEIGTYEDSNKHHNKVREEEAPQTPPHDDDNGHDDIELIEEDLIVSWKQSNAEEQDDYNGEEDHDDEEDDLGGLLVGWNHER